MADVSGLVPRPSALSKEEKREGRMPRSEHDRLFIERLQLAGLPWLASELAERVASLEESETVPEGLRKKL